jgi:CMP-N-acetylneuraminic acid synthetase
MNILITVCARGGSKGIPGKNIKLLNSKPLILYTIDSAERFMEYQPNSDLQLSTDNEEIAKTVADAGYPTSYRRPAQLASDNAGKIDAIKDAWRYAESFYNKQYDFVIDLDVTSPLRNLNDLKSAYIQLNNNPIAMNVFSVSPANRNPYFNMVELKEDGYVKIVKNAGDIKSRQQAPLVFDMNASFYIFSRKFMEEDYHTSITEKSLAYVMDHVCFDLDHPMDFTMMELLLKNNLLDFEL